MARKKVHYDDSGQETLTSALARVINGLVTTKLANRDELAFRLKMSTDSLNNFLSRGHPPKVDLIERIAGVLGVSVADLVADAEAQRESRRSA